MSEYESWFWERLAGFGVRPYVIPQDGKILD